MNGNIDNLGAANLLKNKNDKHPRSLLRILPLGLGLMLVCRNADASTLFTSSKVDVLSDSVISWGIGIFVIIIAMFIALIVIDAKKNGRQE